MRSIDDLAKMSMFSFHLRKVMTTGDGGMRLKGRCSCALGACAELKQSEQVQDRCTVLSLFAELTGENQHRADDARIRAIAGLANYAISPAGMFS